MALPDGVSTVQIEWRGVLFSSKSGMVFVENCSQDEEGNFHAIQGPIDGPHIDERIAATRPLPPRNVASPAEGALKMFMEEIPRRNLNSEGEYGFFGPYIRKLWDTLRHMEDGEVKLMFGTFLQTGNHQRHGTAAAVMSLGDRGLNRLAEVLDCPAQDLVEEFVDEAVMGRLSGPVEPPKVATQESFTMHAPTPPRPASLMHVGAV